MSLPSGVHVLRLRLRGAARGVRLATGGGDMSMMLPLWLAVAGLAIALSGWLMLLIDYVAVKIVGPYRAPSMWVWLPVGVGAALAIASLLLNAVTMIEGMFK